MENIPTVLLADCAEAFDVVTPLSAWVEPARRLSIKEAALYPDKFVASDPDIPFELHDGNTLWVRLKIQRPEGTTQACTLTILRSFIDSVTLYPPDGAEHWNIPPAGEKLPQTLRSKQGLHPEFDLITASDRNQDIYLQIRNF